jgi:hypothetical protein
MTANLFDTCLDHHREWAQPSLTEENFIQVWVPWVPYTRNPCVDALACGAWVPSTEPMAPGKTMVIDEECQSSQVAAKPPGDGGGPRGGGPTGPRRLGRTRPRDPCRFVASRGVA